MTPDEAPRFWLTGKLYCGKCGTPMQGCSGTSGHGGTKHYYYACGAARKKKYSLKYVKKDKIEAIACFMLSECLKDTELLACLAVDVAAYYQKEHEDKNADLNDSAVRDYLLDYFVDKVFVYDDRIILTAWYGDDKKEITWGDIDCVVMKDRKRKKGLSASGSVPPQIGLESNNFRPILFAFYNFVV